MESVRAFTHPGLTANCKSMASKGPFIIFRHPRGSRKSLQHLSLSLYPEKKTTAPAVSGNAPTDVPSYRHDTVLPLPPEVPAEALAVDAACSGNPGPMEYRGVYLRTGETVFHFGPVYGTNNIGEFLAIVHALALMEQKNIRMPVSQTAETPSVGSSKSVARPSWNAAPVQKLSINDRTG